MGKLGGCFVILLEVLIGIGVIAILLSGCASHRHTYSHTADSVAVVVREVRETIYDTIDVYLPPLAAERLTPDTFSLLSNEYAESEAEVSGGLLRHTLRLIGGVRRVPAPVQVITRDSVRERVVERVERVEVKAKASWWQKAWRVCPAVLAALLILLWKRYRLLKARL